MGCNAGPFTVGPIIAAPIFAIAAGKNDWSISFVNTPGLTTFSEEGIEFLQTFYYLLSVKAYNCILSFINIKNIL